MAVVTRNQDELQFASYLSVEIAHGFKTRQQLKDDALACWPTFNPSSIVEQVDAAMDSRANDESKWPERTDVDRLVAAFEEIGASGIVALHNPGTSTLEAEASAYRAYDYLRSQGDVRYGYTFYHEEDIDLALDGGPLCLSYACFEGHPGLQNMPAIQEIIALHVKEVLTRHGLQVTWSGNTANKIEVHMLWQKRCPTTPRDLPWDHDDAGDDGNPPDWASRWSFGSDAAFADEF